MHLCVVSFQAILITVLVFQYNYINEVEAEKISVGNWFNSVEKRVDLQGLVQKIIEKVKKMADEVVTYPRRLLELPIIPQDYSSETNSRKIRTDYNPNDIQEDTNLAHLVNSQEMADILNATIRVNNDVTEEEVHSKIATKFVKKDTDPETVQTEVVEEPAPRPKKKKRGKKHKKKIKAKHVPEQRADGSTETDKTELSRIYVNKDFNKKKFRRKKFVKMALGEANNSMSEETKRLKPVDIINSTYPKTHHRVLEIPVIRPKKRRVKKYKRRLKTTHEYVPSMHLVRSTEEDKAEHRRRFHFVEGTVNKLNNSMVAGSRRHKPVDIIVHIKMND